ncbi:hypothetical protein AB0M38_30205 [Streptomyces sp. NPDC051742]|uniref:hypothetical protein n=1 Tax=unclassified Streptomyces TaxID=2593676 RepID=UPI0034312C3D
MSRNRLVPGVEVVTVPGRGLAVRTAEGEFLTVRTGAADESALLALLAGTGTHRTDAGPHRTDAEPHRTDAQPHRMDAELHRVVRAFEEAGYLAEEPPRPPWPADRRDIRLLGDPALTRPLAAYLTALGAEPRTAPALTAFEGAPARMADLLDGEPAAVVWCLDGPVPDGLWEAADRLPAHGVAWLRCHREGWQAYVEPLAAAPGDVTSAHVRARRLAATPAHRELAAYWEGPRTTGAPVPLGVPGAALLAALLADDLGRWATGTPDSAGLPARRRLRQVDLRTLTVTEHPVLPVPAVAPTPKSARLYGGSPIPKPAPSAVAPTPKSAPPSDGAPIPKTDG